MRGRNENSSRIYQISSFCRHQGSKRVDNKINFHQLQLSKSEDTDLAIWRKLNSIVVAFVRNL